MGLGETRGLPAGVLTRRIVVPLLVLIAACAGAFLLSVNRSSAAPKKPNVVVILTDDQRFDEMTHLPATRNLLGEQGTTFSKFFISFPLCCPSRTSMLTGQLAHNHGIGGNFPPSGYHQMTAKFKRNMLQVWLQRAGYSTSHIGKYLNGYGDIDQRDIPPGWSDWHGTIDQTSYDYFNTLINDNGKITRYGDKNWIGHIMDLSRYVGQGKVTDFNDFRAKLSQTVISGNTSGTWGTTDRSKYLVDSLADRAVSFIRRAGRTSKPFYLEYAPPAPHREDLSEQALYRGINPRVPPRYEDDVAGLTAPTSSPSFDVNPSDKGSRIASNFSTSINSTPTNGTFGHPSRQMLDDYYRGRVGSLMAVDDGVSRIVNQLRASGRLNNTLIIFTSDNGWMMGEHRIVGDKYVPYEESLHVPLVMRGPGIPKGQTVNALSTNVDLAATVLDLANIRGRRTQDGVSLLPVAKTGVSPRTAIPIEATRPLFVKPGFPYQWDVPYFGVRTDRWKYIKWEYGDEELYDLQTDPYELTNLAGNPSYSSDLATLRAKALALSTCKGSACTN